MCDNCTANSQNSDLVQQTLTKHFKELMSIPEAQQTLILCGLKYPEDKPGHVSAVQVLTNVKDLGPVMQALFYVLANPSVKAKDMLKLSLHLAVELQSQGPEMLTTFAETFNMAQDLVKRQDPRLSQLLAELQDTEAVVMNEEPLHRTDAGPEPKVTPLH